MYACQSVAESGVAASQEEDGEIEEGESADGCGEVIKEPLQPPWNQVQTGDCVQDMSSGYQPV